MMITPFPERFLLTLTGRYDDGVIDSISKRVPENTTFKKAAVLIGLVKRSDGYHILLTQRAFHLKHHPGQVAFPGGRFEIHSDDDLIDTALRETKEETGIECVRKNILGKLPSLPTVSGYIIHPYVALINPDYQAKIDSNEVASLFEVSANHLLNPKNIDKHAFLINNYPHIVYSVRHPEYAIWGATAQIIKLLSIQVWHE
ncbi:NUDIX hydrolase [Thaumasiovibrio sp. DFM-14]|uniref:NUDIX hydrolase n=1 Tax=Thaumasiovibrio sp. DFM-14 TaxID=3384792 RepID=UPI00399F9D10